MAMVEWKSSLDTGNGTIDGQHHKLVDLINDLYDAMRNQKASDQIKQILSELKDYTVYHFEAEQKLFQASKYPKVDAHLALHKEFVGKLEEWAVQADAGKAMISVDMLNYLTDWLLNHIKKIDKEMTGWL